MNDFPDLIDSKSNKIKETILTLNTVNYQIAELLRIKEELDKRLSALFEHGDEGSKTYTYDKWKVTCTTGYNYNLNKDEYEVIKSMLPECFNPVRERKAYDLDKSIIRAAEKYGSAKDLELLSQIIEKRPKKLNVKVTHAV